MQQPARSSLPAARCAPLAEPRQRLAHLMRCQLGLAAEVLAVGLGVRSAIGGPLQDQRPLELGDAAEQHQPAVRPGVGPAVAERLEAGASLADLVDDPQQVEGRAKTRRGGWFFWA